MSKNATTQKSPITLWIGAIAFVCSGYSFALAQGADEWSVERTETGEGFRCVLNSPQRDGNSFLLDNVRLAGGDAIEGYVGAGRIIVSTSIKQPVEGRLTLRDQKVAATGASEWTTNVSWRNGSTGELIGSSVVVPDIRTMLEPVGRGYALNLPLPGNGNEPGEMFSIDLKGSGKAVKELAACLAG